MHEPSGNRDVASRSSAGRVAARHRAAVAVQATGHGISRSADGGLLINTRLMKDICVSTARRSAVVGPGVVSSELITEAAAHGLAPANGSAPDISVTGYTSGGGLPVPPRTGRSSGTGEPAAAPEASRTSV
ncbi:FAD-binding protein [Streptomyces sp. NPDC051954]|uniref:FAD-binding protein n=1 Tax=Streptomyces sp. NPDC051954 TaxID=3155524 RepID=UPI00342F6447